MKNTPTGNTHQFDPVSVRLLLPGWADEASTLPHPAPLVTSVESALGQALGCSFDNARSVPGAQCLWHAANPAAPPPEHLVCASPVHLMAGSDDAQLVPVERLNLTMEETALFVQELNQSLGETSSAFLFDDAGSWYHKGISAKALDADPPWAVEGHPVTEALPRADEARPWRSLWSETQMVLHQSAVNQARQARGEPTINSVWFWGGGRVPTDVLASSESTIKLAETVVYTDYAFAQGLADLLGVTHRPLSAALSLDLSASKYRHHVVLDTSLMMGNPDFIEQRDLGAQWCERAQTLVAQTLVAQTQLFKTEVEITAKTEARTKARTKAEVKFEVDGLTGCKQSFAPRAVQSASMLSRLRNLSSLFKR